MGKDVSTMGKVVATGFAHATPDRKMLGSRRLLVLRHALQLSVAVVGSESEPNVGSAREVHLTAVSEVVGVVLAWCADNAVELVFTPTYASWVNPTEAHFGPLRQLALANSDYPDHTALAVTEPASAANNNAGGAIPNPPPDTREGSWSKH